MRQLEQKERINFKVIALVRLHNREKSELVGHHI